MQRTLSTPVPSLPAAGPTEASRRLVALGAHVAAPYADLPTARAGMVTGSSAKGLSEAHMPEIDTTQARRRLGWRQEAWLR